MQGGAGLRARGRIPQSFGQDSERFRWFRRGCGLPLPVQERPGWCPSTVPLLELPLGHGWPLLQPSPDALVVSLCSPERVIIIANLVSGGGWGFGVVESAGAALFMLFVKGAGFSARHPHSVRKGGPESSSRICKWRKRKPAEGFDVWVPRPCAFCKGGLMVWISIGGQNSY